MALISKAAELRLARQTTPAVSTDAALDEAFATVSIPERRQDASHASRETPTETAQLAEALREQLSSLNAQRRHLARLLDGLKA